jgi:hypothetical protein
MEWVEVVGRGKVLTYSKQEFAPKGFEEDVPFYIGVVDYGDFRVFGRIDKTVPEHEIKQGVDLLAEPIRLANGQLSYLFKIPQE